MKILISLVLAIFGALLLTPLAAVAEEPPRGKVVMVDHSDPFQKRPPTPWLAPIRLLETPRSEWTGAEKQNKEFTIPDPIDRKSLRA